MARDDQSKKEPMIEESKRPSAIDYNASISGWRVGDLKAYLESVGYTPIPEFSKPEKESNKPEKESNKPEKENMKPEDIKPDPNPNSQELQILRREDIRKVGSYRTKAEKVVNQVGATAKDIQVSFLKGLMENKVESAQFLNNPKNYAVAHGIILDPNVVKVVTDNVLFETSVSDALVAKLGENAARDLLDMRGQGGTAAWPLVAAAAVAAAAAVVTMVVTLVRMDRPEDLRALKGLGPQGIRLPGGRQIGGL